MEEIREKPPSSAEGKKVPHLLHRDEKIGLQLPPGGPYSSHMDLEHPSVRKKGDRVASRKGCQKA